MFLSQSRSFSLDGSLKKTSSVMTSLKYSAAAEGHQRIAQGWKPLKFIHTYSFAYTVLELPQFIDKLLNQLGSILFVFVIV